MSEIGQAATSKYFNTLAGRWNENYKTSRLFKERLDKLWSLLESVPLKNRLVLDLGCGGGMVSMVLAKSGCKITGVDHAENMVAEAKALFETEKLDGRFIKSDATALPFENSFFDVVCCVSVLEWIDNDRDAVSEIARVLKPGGIAVISLPNRTGLFRKAEKLLYYIRKALSIDPGYLSKQKHQYTLNEFEIMSAQAGLSFVSAEFYSGPLSSSGFFRKLARHKFFGMLFFIKLTKPVK